MVPNSVSLEVIATDFDGMIEEGMRLHALEPSSVVVKLPMTYNGLKACSYLSKKAIRTNVTLCFSTAQAMLAARSGATYVSPFIGRLDDIGEDGINLINDIRNSFDNYNCIDTKILAASIRSVSHVNQCMQVGADIATVPYKIFKKLIEHHLTQKGLDAFISDAQKGGYKI